MVLICATLNPRCLANLLSRKIRILRLSVQSRPPKLLAMTGPAVLVRMQKFRLPRHVLKYMVVKRWVTGERAKMDEERIQSELEAEMRHLMELSRKRKFFGHKTLPTDIGFSGFWKLGRDHTDRCGIRYDVYR